MRVARQSRLSHAIAGVAASASFVVLTGLVILLFYPNPSEDWAFWMGAGIVGYGVTMGPYGGVAFVRLFREAAVPSHVCELSDMRLRPTAAACEDDITSGLDSDIERAVA